MNYRLKLILGLDNGLELLLRHHLVPLKTIGKIVDRIAEIRFYPGDVRFELGP